MSDDLVRQLLEVGRDYDFHENALVYSAANRIEALTAENERLRAALELADAALRGANMNMNVVERKVRAALAGKAEQ